VSVANGPAEVYVDSKARGVVCKAEPSCSPPERSGRYKVIVERAGCLPWTTSVTVAAGATARIPVTLINRRGRSRALEANLAFGAAGAAAIGAAVLWRTGAPASNLVVSAHIVDDAGIDVVVRF
jgi:hypothetical protein